ncbi:MAG: winged helix family transcriptional regulator [Roseateles sp.]|nr:MAG: winged helix family transcriptional regulator [Roseateles sp.]
MQSSSPPVLLLALPGLPPSACAALEELARELGWALRRADGLQPAPRADELVVLMVGEGVSLPPRPLPRGVLHLVPATLCDAAVAGAGPQRRLSWPCGPAQLRDALLALRDDPTLRLDALSRTVRQRDRCVRLTPKEFRILELLLARRGEAVAREVLEAALHAWGQEFESNTLDVHVYRLRRKLPEAGLRALRGYGYVLLPPS